MDRRRTIKGERRAGRTERKLLYKVLHSRNSCSVSRRMPPAPVIVSQVDARGVRGLKPPSQDTFSRGIDPWWNDSGEAISRCSTTREKETYRREAIIARPLHFRCTRLYLHKRGRERNRETHSSESSAGELSPVKLVPPPSHRRRQRRRVPSSTTLAFNIPPKLKTHLNCGRTSRANEIAQIVDAISRRVKGPPVQFKLPSRAGRATALLKLLIRCLRVTQPILFPFLSFCPLNTALSRHWLPIEYPSRFHSCTAMKQKKSEGDRERMKNTNERAVDSANTIRNSRVESDMQPRETADSCLTLGIFDFW